MLPKPNSKNFCGAEIQYFRTEPRYWETILERFKDTGLRCVTTYVQWKTHLVGPPDEKNPAGVLDFEGRTDPRLNLHHFLELVEKYGFDLNFRCGPFCCNEMVHGGLPPWLVLGDPNIMVWDYANRPTQGYWVAKREGMQPSYLHPEFLAWSAKWLGEVDQIIVPHLKVNGGCITMINLDNEISYIVKDGFLNSDYNPVNVGPGGFWHQFLREKYGPAAELPEAPRSVPAVLGENLPLYLDWAEFKTWTMCRYIRRLREIHESNGVRDVTFMTNFNPHRPEGVPTRMPAFEEAVGPGGIVGYDFYRGTFMSYSGYQSMARVLKLMNSSLRYTWSAEFMSGIWNKILPSRISDDHMRFMARCALAHGCKALAWFMFHDRDCWGDSPVSSHGHARPSLEVLRETRELLFDRIKGWDSLVPQTDVAVIYDLTSQQHAYIGDPNPCDDNALYVGEPRVDGIACGRASLEYEGLFRIVEHTGRQAAALDLVHSSDRLAAAPLAFLPGSPVIHRKTAEALEEYVAGGGKLIVSGTWPVRNGAGQAIRFLDGIPGSAERSATPLEEHGGFGETALPCSGGDGSPSRPSVSPVSTLEWRQARHATRFGKGYIWWISEGLGSGKPEEDSLEAIAWVTDLLDKETPPPHVRIRPECEVRWVDWNSGKSMKSEGGSIEFRQPRTLGSAVLQRGGGEEILFVLNHYPEAARFELEFADTSVQALIDLDSRAVQPVRDGKVVVDIDRKSGTIFRVTEK